MLGKIIWLIVLIVLFILNAVFYFKDKDKAFLNLIAAGFVFAAILVQIDTIKDYRPEEDIKTKVELENGKEDKLEILGMNMECPKCGRTLWSDDKFCSDCGYEKNISDFGKSEKNYMIYKCPYCKKLNTSKRKFCSDCGKDLTEINKMVEESIISR